ncbi:MAG: PilZ domain-containing protein [Deltaproteobacteria bacterium]|nr:PilZ domain-containing protein [Deltaproteobacteria bacterium]
MKQDMKLVAVFDPEERSRKVVIPLMQKLGYRVDGHHDAEKIASRLAGPYKADLIFLHLAVFGDSYQQITEGLGGLDLSGPGKPPVLAVTALSLSSHSRERLESLGCSVVLSRQAPVMELVFSVNRLLFPKIRELRRYTRIFGGFPVSFEHGGTLHEAEIYNLSREGAFIQCAAPPPEGARLQLRFVLPDIGTPIEVETLVNWVNQPEGASDPLSPTGMGVSFLTLNAEESSTLGRFIEDRT